MTVDVSRALLFPFVTHLVTPSSLPSTTAKNSSGSFQVITALVDCHFHLSLYVFSAQIYKGDL